jgi:hypothetical protein
MTSPADETISRQHPNAPETVAAFACARLDRRTALLGLARGAIALAVALPLAACGRKGPPDVPEDADPKAPRRYPTRGY